MGSGEGVARRALSAGMLIAWALLCMSLACRLLSAVMDAKLAHAAEILAELGIGAAILTPYTMLLTVLIGSLRRGDLRMAALSGLILITLVLSVLLGLRLK